MTLRVKPLVPITELPSHLTPSQYARLWSRSVSQITYLIQQGRIPTYEVLGVMMVPSDWDYPLAYPQNPLRVTRNAAIIARASAGEAYASIARDFGVSRQRIEQIVLRGR